MNSTMFEAEIVSPQPACRIICERLLTDLPGIAISVTDSGLRITAPPEGAPLSDLVGSLKDLSQSAAISGFATVLWRDTVSDGAGAIALNLQTGELQEETTQNLARRLTAAVTSQRWWLYCRQCGSLSVARDGTLTWNTDRRMWCEGDLFDSSACCDCDDGGIVGEHWWISDEEINEQFVAAAVRLESVNGTYQLTCQGGGTCGPFESVAEAHLWAISLEGVTCLGVVTAPQQQGIEVDGISCDWR